MIDWRVDQAVRNNAEWCDAVCRAHGKPGEFREHVWLNREVTPRFYPNLVTLSGPVGAAAQADAVNELLRFGIPGGWAVKDSYARLDLAPLGFQKLFDATWLWRPAGPVSPGGVTGGATWGAISTPEDLKEWEVAWNGGPLGDAPCIFLPALLEAAGIRFVAARREEAIISGAIAYRTGAMVGLSNVFTPPAEARLFWAGCVAAVTELFPGLPLVDYETGDDLEHAWAVGFEPAGPLRVWAKKI